jgi:hypothetical protein
VLSVVRKLLLSYGNSQWDLNLLGTTEGFLQYTAANRLSITALNAIRGTQIVL